MDMKKFFAFRSQLLASTFQASPINLKPSENEWDLLFTGEYKNIDFPVIFKQKCGKKLKDILDTGHVNIYLISDRLKIVLEENRLTGWKVFPIKLYDKKNNEIHGYHGFSIVGRSGPKSYDNCEIIEKKLARTGPVCKFYKGVYIDEWDGCDFFIPAGTCAICITRKTADALKENKITNVCLTNLADEETYIDNILRKNPMK